MKAICVPWRYKDLYDDDVCYTYRISGDFFYAITSPTIHVIFFISCLVSLFFKYIYIVGYTMPPMDLKLFLYYNKYYTNTSLCILQSLQQSSSENQTCAKVTVNVTEIPPPAIDCIECL